MSPEIREESLDTYGSAYRDFASLLDWPTLFILPCWVGSWWAAFGAGRELMLRSVWEGERLLGLAPLFRRGSEAFLLGSPDVCDYLDFVTLPGCEEAFFEGLLTGLRRLGVDRLLLHAQRPDAAVFRGLFAAGGERDTAGCRASFSLEDESFELALPAAWADYLEKLGKKQRHEVRRKLRRLERESEAYRYRIISGREEVPDFLPLFIELFEQKMEKAAFLTGRREQFFKSLVSAAAAENLAHFGLLETGGSPVAAVLYFDYRGRVYLYNSGYDPSRAALSVGLISKLFLIRHALEEKRPVFDFLKGREVYKSRIGGSAVPVYRVELEL